MIATINDGPTTFNVEMYNNVLLERTQGCKKAKIDYVCACVEQDEGRTRRAAIIFMHVHRKRAHLHYDSIIKMEKALIQALPEQMEY